ncbi:PilN domain-containing protein [Paracidovorax avenae]|uniref:PilN domain-containing protein n=1 Tax=Paracidovorax avenae TaxID=80867 RepID=UPI000A549901|nr:PilN domain-containing protein [Paracidovorax avenae]
MPSFSSEARFLGVDLRVLWRDIRQPWSHMHDWPVFAWLTPEAPVRVIHPDGRQSVWTGQGRSSDRTGTAKPPFTALELPEDLVLRRALALPPMTATDVAHASSLEARSISPFPAGDLAWGHCAHWLPAGNVRVDLVLVSRRQIAQYMADRTDVLAGAEPEVWVRAADGDPIVLEGYGEGLRKAHAMRWRRTGLALLGTIGLLLLLIAVTPSLQLRERALEAAQSYGEVAQRVAPVVQQREALMQSAEKLNQLSELVSSRIEPLKVLDRLTQLLPDDTALQSFRLQGAKVTIVGMTANASALMQILGNEAGFKEVRAPSAATRMGNSGKESFAIEFMLDPQVFGAPTSTPARAAASSSAALLPAAVPASAPGSAASMPLQATPAASVSGTAPAAAAPPVGASAPQASFGGVATFGGTVPRPAAAPAPGASSPTAAATRNKP